MKSINIKGLVSFALSFIMLIGVLFSADAGVNIKASAVSSVSEWSGKAASSFARGTGTETDPYIIETADQLYKMVLSNGMRDDGTIAHYKVADGVKSFYLNNADTLDEVKTLVANNQYNNWKATGIFQGVFDGNGVTVYGMVSYNADGFIYALNESACIKNIKLESKSKFTI